MSYRRVQRAVLAGSAALVLAACGGGGSDNVRDEWRVAPPTFQGAEVGPALDLLAGSADSLLASDVLAVHPVVGVVRGQTECNGGNTCGSAAPSVGFQIDISTSDLEYDDPDAEYQAIGTRRGVRVSQGKGPTEISGYSLDRYGYGGWLDHSFFVVESAKVVSEGLLQGTMLGYSYSVGEATGSNPAGAAGGGASWTGVMVGMDVSDPAAQGSVVRGDAEITINDFADPMVGVAFTNIHNLVSKSTYDDMTLRKSADKWRTVEAASSGLRCR